MSALVFLLVAELFVLGAMWHNQSPRSERERESDKPDAAVLFTRMRTSRQKAPDRQKANEQYQSHVLLHHFN